MFNFKNISYFILLTSYLLTSCSVQKQIGKSAKADLLSTSALQAAHAGISIYDPAAGKYLYNYQGDHYFVPASNTKIPTCYAAMKYLGDSLVGLRYGIPEKKGYEEKVLAIKVTADPTFLHTDYIKQPVFDFLTTQMVQKKLKVAVFVDSLGRENTEGLGSGWAWNDYLEYYMAEHNSFPVFGNVINLSLKDSSKRVLENPDYKWEKKYSFFTTGTRYFDSLVNADLLRIRSQSKEKEPLVKLERDFSSNKFYAIPSKRPFRKQEIPFVTNGINTTLDFLKDTLKGVFEFIYPTPEKGNYFYDCEGCDAAYMQIKNWYPIRSQPTDSVLKPMMHRSDNFFAEQMLLMVSNEKLGVMNDEAIIDTLLKTDFKDLPQKPRWADGSGLSRYNLFTPQDMVAILKKMKDEFGMERIKTIFPTGGEGTISSYYKNEAGFIYGKTGTLSGVVAFSGFLYTKKGKLLIFSTIVNNHNESATDVRRAVEKFLVGVRNSF